MNELALFNNLFDVDDFLPRFNFAPKMFSPKVDVKETKDAYTLHMDLPGMSEKDVDIELDHNVLTLSSKHEETSEKKSDENEDEKYLIRERRCSSFSRRFTLPDDVSSDNISASFKNGVLTVIIPRVAAPKAKRIAITCDK